LGLLLLFGEVGLGLLLLFGEVGLGLLLFGEVGLGGVELRLGLFVLWPLVPPFFVAPVAPPTAWGMGCCVLLEGMDPPPPGCEEDGSVPVVPVSVVLDAVEAMTSIALPRKEGSMII